MATSLKEPPSADGHTVAYIIDGMALLHMMKNIPKTFGELAQIYMDKVKELFALPNVIRVDVVLKYMEMIYQ